MNYELTQDPDKAAVIPSFFDADRVGRGYCERPRPAHQFKIEPAPRGLKGYVVKIYPRGASSYSPDRRWLREASVRCVKSV